MDGANEQLGKLLEEVLKSPKYRNICTDFVSNIGSRELSRRRSLKEAIKATKNKLHQVAGSYWSSRIDYTELLRRLRSIDEPEKGIRLREICLEAMECHSSTRERLAVIDDFYTVIFSALPPIRSIIDIGCGLNPLAIPWMRLNDNTEYHAYDIYADVIEFLGEFMKIINIQGRAETRDIIASLPDTEADLAFILKSIPCIEQVDRSAGKRILEGTNADFLLVSFPVRSLGGKDRSMTENYAKRFVKLTGEKNWKIQRFDFETELAYLIER